MKKSIIVVCLLLLAGITVSSCSHKTCPAYRGSISENISVSE